MAIVKSGDFQRRLTTLRRSLANAEKPDKVIEIGAAASGLEEMMRKSGLYSTVEIRPVRELSLDSRWMLGRMLARVMRGKTRIKERAAPQSTFKDELARLKLEKARAIEAQRIGTLPEKEKAKVYADATRQDVLPTIDLLIDVARPYWYAASRKAKHRDIARAAVDTKIDPAEIGPFPLVYIDPPWVFNVYSEKGLERTPDQHYPTLTDEEIIDFKVFGKTVPQLAADDAALLMWCTSSNIARALKIIEQWGFEYKSQAVWVKLGPDGKPISGLGLVFRNMHEVLLYATRGNMPGPQYQPPSVFLYTRGRHSAKPPEVRAEIEKMYPDFDQMTRAEIFSREDASSVPGWSHFGFEANVDDQAAE